MLHVLHSFGLWRLRLRYRCHKDHCCVYKRPGQGTEPVEDNSTAAPWHTISSFALPVATPLKNATLKKKGTPKSGPRLCRVFHGDQS